MSGHRTPPAAPSQHPDPLAAARSLSFDVLLQPLGSAAFMKAHWGRHIWSHRIASPRFEALLTWARLNTLIHDHQPSAPHFRLVKEGRSLPEAAWHRTSNTLRGPLRQVDVERLMAQLRGGASIVWDAIDQVDEPLRTLRQTLERALQSFVFVNLYASFGGVHGLGPHWDDHDVFVLQLAGRKRWRIHPPTQAWPLPDDAIPGPPARYAHDWTLRAGSAIYLPRGWWHRVTPLGEPSLHLTIGVLRPTNLDMVRWLVERAGSMDILRQDLPSGLDRVGRTAHAKALRQALAGWLTADGLAAFERAQAAAHRLEPRPTLQAVAAPPAGAWDTGAGVRLLSTRAQLATRDGHCTLRVATDEWTLPIAARRSMQVLIAGDTVRLGTLFDTVGAELISELITAGVLALV